MKNRILEHAESASDMARISTRIDPLEHIFNGFMSREVEMHDEMERLREELKKNAKRSDD